MKTDRLKFISDMPTAQSLEAEREAAALQIYVDTDAIVEKALRALMMEGKFKLLYTYTEASEPYLLDCSRDAIPTLIEKHGLGYFQNPKLPALSQKNKKIPVWEIVRFIINNTRYKNTKKAG